MSLHLVDDLRLAEVVRPLTSVQPDALRRKAGWLKGLDGECWLIGRFLERLADHLEAHQGAGCDAVD